MNKAEDMGSNDEPEDTRVIVFDNLVMPTDVVGEYKSVEALRPDDEPFVNANAAGALKQVKLLDDVRKCADESGKNLKELFSS